MLIRFEVTNFRSIAETVELSMVAIDRDREAVREAPMLGESILTVAGIYGANASGKSNVLAGFTWLCQAVRQSVRFWEDEIPVEPFAFGDGAMRPTEFKAELLVEDVRFEYVLSLDRDRVRYEGLFHYPQKKRRLVFEQENSQLKLQRGLGDLAGTRDVLKSGKALALSVARRFGGIVSDFANALLRVQSNLALSYSQGGYRRVLRRNWYGPPYPFPGTLQWFDESGSQLPLFVENDELPGDGREKALALLRLADLGIEDVLVDDQEVSIPGSAELRTQRRIRLLHKTAGPSAPLEFAAESEGTKAWFQLIGPVLTALTRGSIVLLDEVDASLHPVLSAELVRLFHRRETNPRGAQLLFTSHDTSLLNYLNRDEVWLTEKREDGATQLRALSDFSSDRVRKSQNLERGYLHGRFGAIPDVDQSELLRALSLVG